MALDLVAELGALVDAFEAGGIDYALCGGLAVAIHGHPRATMDIDVLATPEHAARLLEASRGLGFDIPSRPMTFGLRQGTPREVRRVSKKDPETHELVSLDVLVVGPALESVWDGRIVVTWRTRSIRIVSRAGLIAMKRLAGRPQDLADIAALEPPVEGDDG